jgi:hypothetical protein
LERALSSTFSDAIELRRRLRRALDYFPFLFLPRAIASRAS